jgi:starch synthase
VPLEADGTASGEPREPRVFAGALADRINRLLEDPTLAARLGEAGRKCVLERYSWSAVAEKTAELYRRLCGGPAG